MNTFVVAPLRAMARPSARVDRSRRDYTRLARPKTSEVFQGEKSVSRKGAKSAKERQEERRKAKGLARVKGPPAKAWISLSSCLSFALFAPLRETLFSSPNRPINPNDPENRS